MAQRCALRLTVWLAGFVVLAALSASAQGALCLTAVTLTDFPASSPPATDSLYQDAVGIYLADNLRMASSERAHATGAVPLDSLPSRLILHAPPDVRPAPRAGAFSYPAVSGLSDQSKDSRAVPVGATELFSLGPTGSVQVMTGHPAGGMANWSHATETALSFVRPHVNVQMMMTLEMGGSGPTTSFEGSGMEPRALLAVDHQTRVDSLEIGTATPRFGTRLAPTPLDEPQTAIAADLDLGLLPTFLSQMGLGVSLVVSRGQNTGNLRVALVGITELPVDWAPRERPYEHPSGLTLNPFGETSFHQQPVFPGGIGQNRPIQTTTAPTTPPGEEGGGGGGKPGGPTPIEPVVPEPGTIAFLAGALPILLACRRRRKR